MREEVEKLHKRGGCRVVRNHAGHVKDTRALTFEEYKTVEGCDDSIKDLVMNHITICLFYSQPSVMIPCPTFPPFQISFHGIYHGFTYRL